MRLPLAEDAPATLGPLDRAVLDRLRAIALLLQVGAAVTPSLAGFHVGLRLTRKDQVEPVRFTNAKALKLIAAAAGWSDLLDIHTSSIVLCQTAFSRLAAAEFPNRCPQGLFRLLRHLRDTHRISFPSHDLLLAAGWGTNSFKIYPRLPTAPSAHEALDLLLAVEAGEGLGPGPLGLLARQAASCLCGGPPL